MGAPVATVYIVRWIFKWYCIHGYSDGRSTSYGEHAKTAEDAANRAALDDNTTCRIPYGISVEAQQAGCVTAKSYWRKFVSFMMEICFFIIVVGLTILAAYFF